ncbi:MAG: hypothetical protein AB8B56_14695 [Crocinitomicaceae bacterium]
MNYLIPDSDRTLYVTHEANYRNLKVYTSGKQLIHLPNSQDLRDGQTFQNEDLGEIDLRLSNRGSALEIRVNGLLCPLENPIAINEENLMGLSSLFKVIAILSTIGLAIQFYALTRIGLSIADVILVLFFGIVCTIVYYLAMFFTKKGKVWAYFLGTGTFLLMTLIYTFNILTSGLFENLVVAYSVFLIVRIGILIILLIYLKSVIRVMNAPKNDANQDILDSF